jgi:Lrp/AsnC family transcriptional regulator
MPLNKPDYAYSGVLMSAELNSQDVKILDLLQRDASLTTQEIADQINMSQSPCWRRINRLLEDGHIDKQVAILNREKLGMEVVVFATVNLSTQGRNNLEEFENEVKQFPEVTECYTMAGTWDYMLKIVARNIRHYEIFVREKLMTLAHIGEVHSHIAVTEIKNSTELPLSTQL